MTMTLKNGIVLADKPFKLEGKKVTKTSLSSYKKLPSSLLQSAKTVEEEISRRFQRWRIYASCFDGRCCNYSC